MSLPHFFIHEQIEGVAGEFVAIPLDRDVAAHLKTLRLKAGERIVLIDRPGHGWKLILSDTPDIKRGIVEGCLENEMRSQMRADLTLIQGISAADRMDQTIRQVTELGVSRIIPLESERSNVRLQNSSRDKKRERWQKVAISAAEQSAQLRYPAVERPVGLDEALALLAGYDLLLFFWEEADVALSSVFTRYGDERNPSKVGFFIGPEGGFSHAEAERIKAFGALELSLGPTILRTETAAVVASALILYQLGALGALGALGELGELGAPGAR